MSIISALLTPFTDPLMLLALSLGTFAGVYVGAIPGLTGTMAVSLLVSLTFGWSTHVSLAAMIGVYVGAVFGGSRSAILLNIPGAPAAVATGFDGYPMAQKGKAAQALGITTTMSVVGGVSGDFYSGRIQSRIELQPNGLLYARRYGAYDDRRSWRRFHDPRSDGSLRGNSSGADWIGQPYWCPSVYVWYE